MSTLVVGCDLLVDALDPSDPTIPVATYTVTYNGNGADSGSLPTDATSYENGMTGTELDHSDNLARTGCAFTGWRTATDGTGTGRAGGSTFTMGSADVTLYAQWSTDLIYMVTYNANGADSGSVPTDSSPQEMVITSCNHS